MQELLKILNTYNIKNKLFNVVTNNANNNDTLKEKFKKALNRRDTSWDRAQNSIFCMTHIINLVTQEFIKAIKSKTLNNNIILLLEDDQVKNVITSNDLCIVVKKIFFK
jgi:hypothetical protein